MDSFTFLPWRGRLRAPLTRRAKLTGQKIGATRNLVHGSLGWKLCIRLTTPHPDKFNHGGDKDPHRVVAPVKTEGSEFKPQYCQEFSLLRVFHTGSEVYPASYSVATGGSFPGRLSCRGVKLTTPPTNADVKKMWIYTPTLPCAFMA
jgi:hypothetical protein